MPFQRVPLTYEIRIGWADAGTNLSVNVMHVTFAAHVTLTQAVADAYAEIIEGAFDASGIVAYQSTEHVLDHVIVTDLDAEGAPQFSGAFDAYAGASMAEYLPLQTCAMTEWMTGFRGRSGRGKTYWGGFTEVASDGRPVAGCIAALDDLGTRLLTNLTLPGPPTSGPSIVSRFSGGHLVDGPHGSSVWRPLPRPEAVTHLITARSTETVWKTQRRRAFPG
jgi:hypothetical protein